MKFSTLFLLFSFLFISCGGYNEGVLQKAEKGFIKFVGDTKTVTVAIDGAEGFTLDPKIEVYQVQPGRHTIKIFRNNELVVNRVVLVDNQVTMEIQIP
jgi:ABC-type antimicrobial peptide transport system permease subunit